MVFFKRPINSLQQNQYIYYLLKRNFKPTDMNAPQPVSDAEQSHFLDETYRLLNRGPEGLDAGLGVNAINHWEQLLKASDKPGLAKVTQELGNLKELLMAEKRDAHAIGESLAIVGDETKKIGEGTITGYSTPLIALGVLLVKMASWFTK